MTERTKMTEDRKDRERERKKERRGKGDGETSGMLVLQVNSLHFEKCSCLPDGLLPGFLLLVNPGHFLPWYSEPVG